MIKHVWFDFAGTLFRYSGEYKKVHDELRYKVYAQVIKKPITEKLKGEYKKLYRRYKTNSQVFINLGKHPDFWAATQAKIDKTKFITSKTDYQDLFRKIRRRGMKISLFTNALKEEVLQILPSLDLSERDFDNLLTGEMAEKKPSLDGFYKIIKLSGIEAKEILYVGDRIEGEILPAKEVGLRTALVWADKKTKGADYSLNDISEVLSCLN